METKEERIKRLEEILMENIAELDVLCAGTSNKDYILALSYLQQAFYQAKVAIERGEE